MDMPGLARGRHNAVRLDPAHVERDEDEDKGHDGQNDAYRKHFHGPIGVFAILDHAEHACSEAENDQPEQNSDDDFDDEHGIADV